MSDFTPSDAAADAHAWRLLQAEALIRQAGFVEDPDHPGSFIPPPQDDAGPPATG